MSDLLDLDNDDLFGLSAPPPTRKPDSDSQKLEELFGPETNEDEFDIFAGTGSQQRTESKSSQSMDDFFDSLMSSDKPPHDQSHDQSHDSVLPPTGPSASVSSGSADLLSLDPLAPLPTTNSTSKPAEDSSSTDLLLDFFGSETVTTKEEPPAEEQTKMADGVPERSTKRPPLGKATENSFEDLLQGLSDDSDLDLDDMISDDHDYSTNLESLLDSPDKSRRGDRPPASDNTTPEKDLEPSDITDLVTSTPKVSELESRPDVRVISPEGEVQKEEDDREVEKSWEMLDHEDFEEEAEPVEEGAEPGEEGAEPWMEQRQEGEELGEELDFNTNAGGKEFDEDAVVLRRKTRHQRDSQSSNTDSIDGEDVDFSAVEGANYLDVDISKHKSELGKKGSMALRRKPSRKSRRSMIAGDEDALFQDSTEPKQSIANGDDEDVFDGSYSDGSDKSPPAKKPSPTMMMPLPGMAMRPPSQRLSSGAADDTEESEEPRRSYKPPAGGFRLPGLPPRPASKPSLKSEDDTQQMDTSPAVFERPALRSVTKPSSKPTESDTKMFDKPTLRNVSKPTEFESKDSDTTDSGINIPKLRSKPKTELDPISGDKDKDVGVFSKPPLRSTSRVTRTSSREDREESPPVPFDSAALKSTPKRHRVNSEPEEEKYTFDKPALKSTPKRNILAKEDEEKTYTFDKPVLKSTGRPTVEPRSGSPPAVRAFNKPALRSTPVKTMNGTKPEETSAGVFDKPALRKTTSPEKEVHVKDSQEAKGLFDKPALRKTESTSVNVKSEPTSHFGDLRLKKTNTPPDGEKQAVPGKPAWLQTASQKTSKVLDVIQSKENQNNHSGKGTPSWLDQSPLRKARQTPPLQESSVTNNHSDSQTDGPVRKPSARGHLSEASRSRSVSSEKDDVRESHRKGSLPVKNNNNYTPSWMRTNRSPATSGFSPMSPAKSCPVLNNSDEIPQWKKDLALRRKARLETEGEGSPRKEESPAPEWTPNGGLRKLRHTASPAKEVTATEPEWKRAAEEKRARLRKSEIVEQTDCS